MTATVELQALTTREDRRATLTWAGPGKRPRLERGHTLRPGEARDVLAYLTRPDELEPSDADGPGNGATVTPTDSLEAFTAALTGLAGYTGVDVLWAASTGLALEDLADPPEDQEPPP